MKLLNKFFIPLMAAGVLASCSSEAVDGPNVNELDGNDCYMQLSLSLANASMTRAENEPTAPNDKEYGQGYENKINKAIIVLAEQTTHRLISATKIGEIAGTSDTHSVTAKFTQTALEAFRTASGVNQPSVEVYALCNYPDAVEALTGVVYGANNTSWIEDYSTYTSTDLAVSAVKNNGVFMTNDKVSICTLPAQEVLAKTSPTNPYPLGEVTVSRALARFDYVDGSEGDGIYTVYDSAEDEDEEIKNNDGGSKIQVQITKVAVVNISNKFFNFRHSTTAADQLSAATLFGTGSLVVDYDAANKTKAKAESAEYLAGNFVNPFFAEDANTNKLTLNRAGWNPDDYATLLAGEEDDADWNGNNKSYRIWRYVTENVIPATNNQINGLSTGVIFKGKIKIAGNGKIANQFNSAMDAGKTLYVYNGAGSKVAALGSIQDIVALGDKNNIYSAMAACLKETKTMNENTTDADVDKAKATAAGFTMYEPAIGGDTPLVNGDEAGAYYMYFYYWNRHNDNGDNSTMGSMEFATVRNHVYKLSLTKINKFGHPRKPENDPDPVNPGTPDEDSNAYITVTLKILPWSVRVNDIEF